MKRLLITIFNGLLCYFFAVVLRILIAIPHRWMIGLVSPGRLYYPWRVFPWYMVLLLLLAVYALYDFLTRRFCGGATPGEWLTGIRIKAVHRGWYIFFEMLYVLFWPVAVLSVWISGRMPMDNRLGVEVSCRRGRPVCIRRKYRVLSLLFTLVCLSAFLYYGFLRMDQEERLWALYYGTGPFAILTETNSLAGIYSACAEAESFPIGTCRLEESEMEEWEKYIFSEEGMEEEWAFVITFADEYGERYTKLGAVTETFDYDNYILAVTFGRELYRIRIVDEPYLKIDGSRIPGEGRPYTYMHPVLGDQYEQNTIYFYAVSQPNIYKSTRIYEMGFYDKVFWPVGIVGINFDCFATDPASAILTDTEAEEGIWERWKWSYHWANISRSRRWKTMESHWQRIKEVKEIQKKHKEEGFPIPAAEWTVE